MDIDYVAVAIFVFAISYHFYLMNQMVYWLSKIHADLEHQETLSILLAAQEKLGSSTDVPA